MPDQREVYDAAKDEVESALRYCRDDDARWAVMTEALERYEADALACMVSAFRLEALCEALCPGVGDRLARRLYGRKDWPIERRIHELRLQAATAPRPGSAAA